MYRAQPSDGIAWITGASSGMGRGVALELARRGFVVAATARRADLLASLTQEAPGKIFAFPGDVTDATAMAALHAEIESAHGPVALAFLNAGGIFRDGADDPAGEGARRTFDLNVMGTLNCLAPVSRAMIQRRKGQIALCASLAGYTGLPTAAAYSASKAALIALGQGLHVDLSAHGVALQVVCPGYVRTPLTDNIPHETPFMLELDDAVARICKGFETGGFEIAFPKRLWLAASLLRLMPQTLRLALLKRRAGKGQS